MTYMPVLYLRTLAGSKRTKHANRQIAQYLAFIAGATNAGGFLAVRQYTSHMSGIVAGMADSLALGSIGLVCSGLGAVFAFVCGALVTTLLIRWARERALESEYALPLIVEAMLLVTLGLIGGLVTSAGRLETVMLLCFTMGLQNAMITKLSNAVIRTTHVTGMLTDVGIAMGRMAFNFLKGSSPSESIDQTNLKLLTSLILLFFAGGVIGAVGFKRVGYRFTLPLAGILLLLAIVPVMDDIRKLRKRPERHQISV